MLVDNPNVRIEPPRTRQFWALEDHGEFTFRWTRQRFSLRVPDRLPFVTLRLASPLAANVLTVSSKGHLVTLPLLSGWQSVDLPTFGADRLDFELAFAFDPDTGDQRELGMMLRDALFHADTARHASVAARQSNARLNEAEYRAGSATLTSVPQRLRITTSKTCNIANEKACVYCSWDWTKRLEQGSPDQDDNFLSRMGRYFDLAAAITDCSYGEPPLEKDFAEIVVAATDLDRSFEFTSNGQPLSAKNRAKLLGKTARVHVSLDSASAEGYRRYRDHRFDLIVGNLRDLCRERTVTGNLPEVFVSFIVMRSNMHEAGDFLRLMQEVGVDRVTFRDLYRDPEIRGVQTLHYGYRFDYDTECLTASELTEIGPKYLALGREIGLPVRLEWSEFSQNVAASAPGEPICSEPWQTAYVLARGIMPCCYGREPIVKWSEIDQTDLEAGLGAALNSAPFQELRQDLAAGKLGHYCKSAHSCPIVKAKAAADAG